MITFKYLSYSEIEPLSSEERIKKLISMVKGGKIVLLQGTLKKEEEALLIEKTMKMISPKFKGVEIAVISQESSEDDSLFTKIKSYLATVLLGTRQGITIIGDASLVKEIRQDPTKIELLTVDPDQIIKKKRTSKKK